VHYEQILLDAVIVVNVEAQQFYKL